MGLSQALVYLLFRPAGTRRTAARGGRGHARYFLYKCFDQGVGWFLIAQVGELACRPMSKDMALYPSRPGTPLARAGPAAPPASQESLAASIDIVPPRAQGKSTLNTYAVGQGYISSVLGGSEPRSRFDRLAP